MKLLKVDTVEEVKLKIDAYFDHLRMEDEEIKILEGLGRISSEDIYSTIDLPEFHRSTVDGYAVCSKDTFGVSESLPTFLEVIGKVNMGQTTDLCVESGKAVYVPTGAMLPKGADAVVMIEYAEHLDEETIAVYRPVAPGEGVIHKGEDINKKTRLLIKGKQIRSQDIGALAAIGVNKVKVFQKPKIAILSTGDEIVDPIEKVEFGKIRDINTYALSAMAMEMGGAVTYKAVIKDDFNILKNTVESLIDQNDLVVISGGSSVGLKDVTAKVIDDLGEPGVFVHGIAIKPGKPTIIGKVRNTAVLGLPGHPVSAIMIFKVFGEYMIHKMLSKNVRDKIEIQAISEVNIPSSPGKETYQMVTLEKKEGQYIAKPIHGKSGAISLIVEAQGYIKIDANKEGIKKGESVKVTLL
jgi:molybdopterin molybdotransferase